MDEPYGEPRVGQRCRKRSTRRVRVVCGKWIGCRPRRTWCEEERHEVTDTKDVDPEPEQVIVSHHTVMAFMQRFPEEMDVPAAVQTIKRAVVTGRRSDRDHRLLREIRPWLTRATMRHYGRSVTIFMDSETRLCVLAVIDRDCPDVLATLTCFVARDKATEDDMAHLPKTDPNVQLQPHRVVQIKLADLRRRIQFGLPINRDEVHWLVEQVSGVLERHPVRCQFCNATGRVSGIACDKCGGTGYFAAQPVVYEVLTEGQTAGSAT